MWNNYGKILAEYVFIKILDKIIKKLIVKGQEILRKIKKIKSL